MSAFKGRISGIACVPCSRTTRHTQSTLTLPVISSRTQVLWSPITRRLRCGPWRLFTFTILLAFPPGCLAVQVWHPNDNGCGFFHVILQPCKLNPFLTINFSKVQTKPEWWYVFPTKTSLQSSICSHCRALQSLQTSVGEEFAALDHSSELRGTNFWKISRH